MNFPRKRPQSQGSSNNNSNNNNQRRRFSNNGSGGQSHSNNNNGGGNRPRKNYGAMREKYLTQARDALSMGDRVLAENYFQHADHCFRMIAEENANRPQRAPQPQHHEQNSEQQAAENVEAPAENASEATQENSSESSEGDDSINLNVSSLPAFLTASYTPPKVEGQPTPQNWEE